MTRRSGRAVAVVGPLALAVLVCAGCATESETGDNEKSDYQPASVRVHRGIVLFKESDEAAESRANRTFTFLSSFSRDGKSRRLRYRIERASFAACQKEVRAIRKGQLTVVSYRAFFETLLCGEGGAA